ncbi:MAG: hypothetical protein WKF81_04180 [Thermomicrobiales bacterium]
MDTAVVVLVLILVVALFGLIAWLFIREVGWHRARLLVVAPFVGAISSRSLPSSRSSSTSSSLDVDRQPALSQIPAVSEDALRALREEIQGELVRATGFSREVDARLTRIEATYGDSRRTPDELEETILQIETKHGKIAEQLHRELGLVQRSASSFGERRVTAVADLYSHLARVEAALAGVVNPALLPGEPLSLPGELGADAFVWDNWRDVGDRAFAFGDVFNQHRYVLDDPTASAVESFITTLRQALTGAIYPNVQAANPTPGQRTQVRSGLTLIVTAIPDIRRKLESAYRADAVGTDALELTRD